MGTFKVAPGKSLISVGELLAWIADTAEPPDERLPTLATLRIQTRIGTNAQGNAHYLEAELTEADWQTLDAAWIDLPPVKDAPEDAWPKYVEALERWKHEHAADAPSWQLAATFINHKQLARDRRMVVFNAHHDFLQKSLNDGSVKALNSLGVPTETLSFDTVLKVDEVRKYLSLIHI